MADMAASVLARLKNKAAATGRSHQLCMQLFCQEEFLRKLSMSKYADNLVLKGGLFIYTLTNFESRATVDIDFLMRQLPNSVEEIENIIAKWNIYKFDFVDDNFLGVGKQGKEKIKRFCELIKNKKIPMRSCVVTREKLPKGELLRIVKTTDGSIIADISGKINGRGAYIKKDIDVLEKAIKSKVLERQLETTISMDVYEEIRKIIEN